LVIVSTSTLRRISSIAFQYHAFLHKNSLKTTGRQIMRSHHARNERSMLFFLSYSISLKFDITIQALQLANKGINPDALLIGQKLCIPKTGNRFTSEALNISFLYPLNWNMTSDDRYEGEDGFFQVSAVSSNSIDEVCKNEAYHELKPYGSQPTIVNTSIQGQDACLLFPYPDQPAEMLGQSALIVTYPRPIALEGQTYNFFILWADQNHIREIVNTLTFLVP
jgi:TolB protein